MYSISPQQGVKGGAWRSKYPVTHQRKWPIERWNKCPILDPHSLPGKPLQLSTQTRSVYWQMESHCHTGSDGCTAGHMQDYMYHYTPYAGQTVQQGGGMQCGTHFLADRIFLGVITRRVCWHCRIQSKNNFLCSSVKALGREGKGLGRGRDKGRKKEREERKVFDWCIHLLNKVTYNSLDTHVPIQPVHQFSSWWFQCGCIWQWLCQTVHCLMIQTSTKPSLTHISHTCTYFYKQFQSIEKN